jgi:hypothetical protein
MSPMKNIPPFIKCLGLGLDPESSASEDDQNDPKDQIRIDHILFRIHNIVYRLTDSVVDPNP